MAMIHRLTVDGRDYFLPDPVTELKGRILEAIKAGGGYVNIPPLRGGPASTSCSRRACPWCGRRSRSARRADSRRDAAGYDPEL